MILILPDKPRQHIKKQRHYFTDKGLYSQSYGFSSSHARMWELGHKEAPKNWCFWTVVLEKTLESPLDCKQIQLLLLSHLSRVQLFATPWIAAGQASLSITNSRSLLKLMLIESVMPSSHLILCHPLLPSIFRSIRVFSNESALHIRWPKYWSFSFSISPSNEHQELISFRMDWLDLLAVQGTLKSLVQCHSSKASLLWCSAFFLFFFFQLFLLVGD